MLGYLGSAYHFLISILVLEVLIFVHELGHFLLAKWNRVGVVDFSLGFGKILWKRKIGETTYALRAIPFGGFVRMVGDDPRMLGESSANESESPIEPTSDIDPALLADKSRWFLNQGYWAKFSIVFAGPFFNLLFAYLLGVAVVTTWGFGVPRDEPVVGGLIPDQPAERIGVKEGDRIVRIDGASVVTWKEMAERIAASKGESLALEIERPVADGQSVEALKFSLTGELPSAEMEAIEGKSDRRFRIGITPIFDREPAAFSEALKFSAYNIWNITELTFRGLYGMVAGIISPKNLGGPILILKEAATSSGKGLERLCSFMIFLSVSLAILNLFPIPVLDGGHLVFFTLEALLGRPVSMKFQERATQVGMVMLLTLMLFAVYNDIMRYFAG